MSYRVLTSGPCMTREGSLAEVKQYVERCAPLKRGWTGEWSQIKRGDWVYRRFNSKGRLMKGYEVRIIAGQGPRKQRRRAA